MVDKKTCGNCAFFDRYHADSATGICRTTHPEEYETSESCLPCRHWQPKRWLEIPEDTVTLNIHKELIEAGVGRLVPYPKPEVPREN